MKCPCFFFHHSYNHIIMGTLTAPQKRNKMRESGARGAVLVPRREYEYLMDLKNREEFSEFIPTASQKNALARAEENFRKGKTISYYELTRKLGYTGR